MHSHWEDPLQRNIAGQEVVEVLPISIPQPLFLVHFSVSGSMKLQFTQADVR